MRRFFSLFLALIIFICIFSSNVHAIENTSSEYENMINLACEVFPEFSDEFTDPTSFSYSNQRTASVQGITYSETRQYDDMAFLTYTKFSDGLVVLSSTYPTDTKTINSFGGGSGGTTYSMTLELVCPNYQGCFILENISFTIASGANDIIHNCGSASSSTVYDNKFLGSILTESPPENAYIRYKVTFYCDDPSVSSNYRYRYVYYTFYVGGNNYWTQIQG